MAAQFENYRDISYVNLGCLFAPTRFAIMRRPRNNYIGVCACAIPRFSREHRVRKFGFFPFFSPVLRSPLFLVFFLSANNIRLTIERIDRNFFVLSGGGRVILTFSPTNIHRTDIGYSRINESVLVSKGPETRVAPGGK